MANVFLGQISLVSFNFPPKGWAFCNGQTLAINQNQALFALLGTMYGGNGQTTFQLPNLQSRVPVHRGSEISQGAPGGQVNVTLTPAQTPGHTHPVMGTANQGTTTTPLNNVLAEKPRRGSNVFALPPAAQQLHVSSVTQNGGSQAHPNEQPYLTLNYIIALVGIFPSRS